MKKLTYFILGALIILLPLTVSALEMLPTAGMKAVTGQAGVDIAIDDVILYQKLGIIKFTDIDGNGQTPTEAASIITSNLELLQTFEAITTGTDTDLNYSTGTMFTGGYLNTDTNSDGDYDAFTYSPLTIDVGICRSLTAGYLNNNPSATDTYNGVTIGLPTLEINANAETQDIGIESKDVHAVNNGTIIRLESGASTMAVLGGRIEIAAH